VPNRGLLLDGHQAANVVDLQLRERRVEVDRAVLNPVAIQHRENALAHRCDVRQFFDIAIAKHNAAAIDHDQPGRVRLVADEFHRLAQPGARPAVCAEFGRRNVFPGCAGENRRRRSLRLKRQDRPHDEGNQQSNHGVSPRYR